jgi:hypothetical protein
MKHTSSEQDRNVIELLKHLGSFKPAYPSELLTARRAAFLARVEQLTTDASGETFSPEDQGILNLLGSIQATQPEYPPELLAARRSALLQRLEEVEKARTAGLWDRLRSSIQTIFPTVPARPLLSWRDSLVVASLVAVVVFGSLFFLRRGGSLQPLPVEMAREPTQPVLSGTGDVAITICKPDDEMSGCALGEPDPSQDLANQENGTAKPAVGKDGVHSAAYVNDGRRGTSWVSNSADSWIKIDLGTVRTINTVSLRKGSGGLSDGSDPCHFVIAVALSDVYVDGDSSHDYTEYAQIFHSEQTGFSGRVSPAETIQTRFRNVQARFVKITFKNAGAAIEEVGVFMVEPPALAEPSTTTPQATLTGMTQTPTGTLLATLTQTASLVPTATRPPTETAVATNTLPPTASITPVTLPTNSPPPTDPVTPVPTRPLPSNTPVPSPTEVPPTEIPPTAVPPTAVSPTDEPPPSSDPIIVTGNGHTATFTCNGNAAEIRGHANHITLLGSCSSITVTGNGNRVFWESGSPVIIDRGNDNIIQQL